MSSDEEDYMSDAFLTGCIKEDVRPGLIYSKTVKRHHEISKKKNISDEKNKTAYKPKHVLEKETRETALAQPISEENKGFKMLQKLGFKPGSGLGKSSQGCKDPVAINVKSDRDGLGRMEEVKRALAERVAARRQLLEKAGDVGEYRSRLAEEAAERRARVDLKKSQRICRQLDLDAGTQQGIFPTWFWCDLDVGVTDGSLPKEDEAGEYVDEDSCGTENRPAGGGEKEEEEEEEEHNDDYGDDEDNYSTQEKLELLTWYLRTTHFYCVWCRIKFSDSDDMREECPGPTYEDH